ncbi:MAG: hypothetical protein ACLR43_04560 [Faecalibacillus faecis]
MDLVWTFKFIASNRRKECLTGSCFSNYSSPVPFIGPKRFSKLPIDIENMPSIDVLAISHDHYDV